MEADWEFDLGSDSPLIDADWPGLIDLRCHPESVDLISETNQLTGLASALLRLNAARSPVWTCKCDVWTVDEFDADELDAPPELMGAAVACYIDVLPRNEQRWDTPERAERACRALCSKLHSVSLRGCRADLVIRRAQVARDDETLGMTAYLIGCGPTEDAAKMRLSSTLLSFAESVDALLT